MAQIEKFRIENTSRGNIIAVARKVVAQLTTRVHTANDARFARVGILISAVPRCGSPNPAVVVRDVVTVLAVLVTGRDKNEIFHSTIGAVAVVSYKVYGM